MVYFDNTTETQRVHIPRTNIEASAYHPSTGGTEQYYAGTNIEITPSNVINVTGLTEAIESTVTGMTLDYATTGDVETMISEATSDFVTSGDVQSQITAATSDFVTSGDVETMVSGFTTSGDVETMISSATSGMATTQYVDNAVSGKADTTAVTQSISSALTAHTPTSNFATINGSGITEGGNIVIESGGDSTALEMITELPSDPVDGAVYNYNGVLIKYVNGAGKWGYWTDIESMECYSQPTLGSATLFYGVIPSSMDGQMVFGFARIVFNPADGNVRLWGFFNLQNNTIDFYDNKDKTGTTLYSIARNAGSETLIYHNYSIRFYLSWNDNVIQVRSDDSNTQLVRWCDTEIQTAHYELSQELPYNYPITRTTLQPASIGGSQSGYLSFFDNNTGRAFPAQQIGTKIIWVNNAGSSSALTFYGTSTPIQRMYVPIASGATGSLVVSQGPNDAPVFKTIADALGIDFWTGSQDDYDAMASHSPTTLYIIIPDNS